MPLCVETHRRMTAFAFWKPVTIKVTSTRPLVRGVAQRAAKSAAVICEVGIGGGLGGGGDGDGGRFGKPKGTSGGWFGDGAIGGGRGRGGSDGGMGPRSGSAFATHIMTPGGTADGGEEDDDRASAANGEAAAEAARVARLLWSLDCRHRLRINHGVVRGRSELDIRRP